MDIFIKRNGNTIEISGPDNSPLPRDLVCKMNVKFKYSRREQKFVNYRMQYTFDDVYLCFETPHKTLVSSYGMFPSIYRWLKDHKYNVRIFECTPPEKNFVKLEPDWSVLDNYELREGQRECLEAFDKKKHGIVCATVGFGKTFLLGLLIQMYPKSKFHIVTRSKSVLHEIYTRLVKVSPNVGIFCSDKKVLDKRVMCITADSLGRLESDVDFLIFDECHQAAAPTYSKAITEKYTHARCYGFTATPTGRSDGADNALTFLFGDVIYTMSYADGVEKGLVVPINVEWLRCSDCDSAYSPWSSKVTNFRNFIWRNDYRNGLIAKYVHDNLNENEQVLILVASVEHAVYLHQFLPEYTLVYGTMQDVEFYKRHDLLPEDYKVMSAKERKQAQEDFKSGKLRKVIATDVWSTGVDFPSLRCVVMGSARSSSIMGTQSGGRVSRLSFGKNGGTVVDIVDAFEDGSTPFMSSSKARQKTYKSLGWTQNAKAFT